MTSNIGEAHSFGFNLIYISLTLLFRGMIVPKLLAISSFIL